MSENNAGKTKRVVFAILTHVFLMALVLIIVLPVLWLIINSLKTNQEMFVDSMSLPKVIQWGNYVTAWGKGLYNYFLSSVITSAISIFFILALSTMLAYGLTRFDLKGKDIIFFIVLGGMALSEQVALVPLFKMIRMMHLYDTRAAIILPYIAFRIPFTMFLLRSYFMGIPRELEEAAYIDGATTFQIFYKIILPISKPVLASAAIVNLNFVWNEFLFANVFLESKKLMTIPLGIMSFQGDLKSDYVTMLAGILIASLPMIIIYLSMQKQFVRGLTAGAVKG
ncbi:MAG: carbohydrate ABC transporter permease [Dorea sp.]|nr:carbohydrate ABC transporter permease [Dorea sp.]